MKIYCNSEQPKIKDYVNDLLGTDLWVRVYNRYNTAYYCNFVSLNDNLLTVKFVNAEFIPDDNDNTDTSFIEWLMNREYPISLRDFDRQYTLAFPIEMYSTDDVMDSIFESLKYRGDWSTS